MPDISGSNAIAGAFGTGGLGLTITLIVNAWRKGKTGQSEDVNAAMDRQAKRQRDLERERDYYATGAAALRRQVVGAGMTPDWPKKDKAVRDDG